jgi:hypothetical protein
MQIMKHKIFISVFIISCGLLFTTCKKYPEGGTEKDGQKNLINKWQLTLYEVDGIDSTNLINYNGNENYKQLTFTPAQALSNTTFGIVLGVNNYGYKLIFTSNNEVLNITSQSYSGAKYCDTGLCIKEIFTPESNSTSWKILKLDSKEWHIQSQQIHSYNLKFIKIN